MIELKQNEQSKCKAKILLQLIFFLNQQLIGVAKYIFQECTNKLLFSFFKINLDHP